MKYKKVVRLYSNSRVSKYYKATNRNKNKAVMLYFANMKIAQAFHPLLSSFEAILRNRINHNEPICFVNRKCDFSYVKNMYMIISDFLTWIDPEIMPSLREVDKVCKIIEKEENKQKQ